MPAAPWWIVPAGCAVVSFVLAVAGVLSVLRAQRRLARRIDALEQHAMEIADPARLRAAAARIARDGREVGSLLERASTAYCDADAAVRRMHLPEALQALRLAIAAARTVALLR